MNRTQLAHFDSGLYTALRVAGQLEQAIPTTEFYQTEELHALKTLLEQGSTLEQIVATLHRSVGGAVQKLMRLAKRDPVNWKPDLIAPYVRQYEHLQDVQRRDQKREYKHRVQGRWERFGKFLGYLIRRDYGTQRAFARFLGRNSGIVNSLVHGNYRPSDVFLQELAERCHLDLEFLRSLCKEPRKA